MISLYTDGQIFWNSEPSEKLCDLSFSQSFNESDESNNNSVDTLRSDDSSSQSPPKTKDWRLKHVDEKEALDKELEDNESSSSDDEIDKIDNNATPAPTSRSRKILPD